MKTPKLWILCLLCVLIEQSHQQEATENVTEEQGDVELIPAREKEAKTSAYNHQVAISYGCPVNPILPCVSKCCDLNQTHANLLIDDKQPQCVQNPVDFWLNFQDRPNEFQNKSLPVQDRYEYFIGDPCATGKYILEPELFETDKYFLYSNGTILLNGKFHPLSDYCVDYVDNKLRAFICFETASPENAEFYHILYPVGQLLSIPFLLATAAMYLAIEQFRDLQGKTLVCHVSCLTIAFFFLAFVQLSGGNLNQAVCTGAAFIIQFSFVACFFWLNVLCYDSYRNMRDELHINKTGSISERRRFIMYSLYAWNGPLILFIVSLVVDMVPGLPDSFLRPEFGSQSCWFSSETAALPYFFGPVGILLGINLIFFGLTAYFVINMHKAAYNAQNVSSEDKDRVNNKKKKKYRFYMKSVKQCFKLFLTMGLCWLAEIISWAIGGPRYVWITTDIINTLQGLLIFYFYVWEPKRVRNELINHARKFWSLVTHCKRSSNRQRIQPNAPLIEIEDTPNEYTPMNTVSSV